MKLLLERNPDSLHTSDYRFRVPLHYAAIEGHIEVVKFLLDQGANVDSRQVNINFLLLLFLFFLVFFFLVLTMTFIKFHKYNNYYTYSVDKLISTWKPSKLLPTLGTHF